MKVLLTGGGSGGHVSPSLAVAQRLRSEKSQIELLYVGGQLTMEGSVGASIEKQLIEPTGIPFVAIHAGKLKRTNILSLGTITRLWGVIPGLFEAWRVVGRFNPDVVFSSGGYVSLPVVVAAWGRRVPIVIHEQTSAVGLTNWLAGRLATKVAITFTQSAPYFNQLKVVLTGNPLRPEVIQPDMATLADRPLAKWLNANGLPIIYITGGGLGSHLINQAVEGALGGLLTEYRVVHQAGSHQGYKDLDHLAETAKRLPTDIQRRYWVAEHYSSEEVGLIYQAASAVVARSGANTVLEIAAWGLPAIFIPIPWVTHQEQFKNAQVLVEAGTAKILPEAELSSQRLIEVLAEMMTTRPQMVAAQDRAKAIVDLEATQKLADLVFEVGKK